MTQLYEAAATKTTGAAAGAIVTLVAPSTSRPDVREIGIFIAPTAVAATIGLGRPAAIGAGAPTGTLGQALDTSDPAATCTLATTFATTQPTAPTNFFRRIDLPASVGAGILWVYGINELTCPVSGNIVIWQISSLATTYDVYVKWEE